MISFFKKSVSPAMWLALLVMITGTFLAMSAPNWFTIWVGLEVNMFSFIPFMSKASFSKNCEAATKYLLIQVVASMIMLYSGYFVVFMQSTNKICYLMLIFAFMMKLGTFPAHYWFPSIMQSCDWFGSLLLATWQKIAPAMVLIYNVFPNKEMLTIVVIINVILGSTLGSNQTDIKTIMAYSSVVHMGWFLIPYMYSMNYQSMYYLTMYIFMSAPIFIMMYMYSYNNPYYTSNIMSLNTNMKFSLMLMILSLAGLPPLSGFMPKIMILYYLSLNSPMLAIILVVSTCISLYFYLTLSFNIFFTNKKNLYNLKLDKYIIMSTIISIMFTPLILLY
uniref:NADH dehydrogenase subunit 2 n=1 Tax=Batracobdella cancricola TaxID=3027018 RepID=UPI0023D8708E|nr:NADH dehydrogenase subunit 2 [Batracobdella cancricola]WDA96149.1 NADH dehydrogenase subunit 2 [Batracobdella cancricola]